MFQDDLDNIIFNTSDLLIELQNKKIFITGGTGFLGTLLLESFAYANDYLGLNATALVLTRNQVVFAQKVPHLANHPSIEFLRGDIRSFEFPLGSYPYIIHAATGTAHDLYDENPLFAFDTIVSGTRHVLDFACQANTQKILFLSSGAIYGKQPPNISRISENHFGSPQLFEPYSVYSEGKRVSEMLSYLYARKYHFEIKIARCFGFVGPYMPLDQHFAPGNFIRNALRGGPICVNSDGIAYRSYMYADDLVVWLWTILFNGENCRPYNVGSDEEIQIKDLANIVANETSDKIEVIIKKTSQKTLSADRYVPDINRARNELGLSINTYLVKAIRQSIQWHSRQKKWRELKQ